MTPPNPANPAAVISGENEKATMIVDHNDKSRSCNLCGNAATAPYLFWVTDMAYAAEGFRGELVVCDRCCSRTAHGLIADLIGIKANSEIEGLTGQRMMTVPIKRDEYEKQRSALDNMPDFCRDPHRLGKAY